MSLLELIDFCDRASNSCNTKYTKNIITIIKNNINHNKICSIVIIFGIILFFSSVIY
jgi:hypothetical protein